MWWVFGVLLSSNCFLILSAQRLAVFGDTDVFLGSGEDPVSRSVPTRVDLPEATWDPSQSQ